MKRTGTIRPDVIGRTLGSKIPVLIREGLAGDLGRFLPGSPGRRRVCVVTDRTVARLHGAAVRKSLESSGFQVDWIALPPGESIKSSRVVSALHERWFRRGYDRSTTIIALGGGTIGDAVGFAAATFMRGLPLLQVPTTLIGQVDSALGGKVGINHPRGKNLIGCYYHPAAVVMDPTFLTTLPIREIRSGLAEVVKYGIIADMVLFRKCERSISGWLAGGQIDQSTIKRCVAIKLRVVHADERDMGKRHILNFGHTLGHAFEAWGGFRLLKHGEAVTLGMAAAANIAHSRGMLKSSALDRIIKLCGLIAPSIKTVSFDARGVTPFLKMDKKRSYGVNAWVLPVRIGGVTIVRDVTDNEIRAAIGFVREWLGQAR